MTETKQALRSALLSRRKSLQKSYIAAAGDAIQAALLASPLYRSARSVFMYLSMPGEVPTGLILERAFADGKKIYVPKCVGPDMLAVPYPGPGSLRPGAFGIPEPVTVTSHVRAAALDLIIVPCLAAWPDGRRLGHGKGYYDRFLQGNPDHAVCLCFQEMLCQEIPMEPTDVFIPFVITETFNHQSV